MPALPTNNSSGFSAVPAFGNFPAQSAHRDGAIAKFLRVGRDLHREAELPQALDHDLRVLAPKRALQRDLAVRQRGQDQRAVGDALRAGHGDFRVHRFVERHDFDEVGQRFSFEF